MNKKSTFRSVANNYLTHPKGNSGITLIALVVTIIVLLILAGISIGMLTGNNGILKQARNAKTETIGAGTLEQIKIEVLGSFDKEGYLDLAKLTTNLQSIGATVTGSSFPITVTFNGLSYTINSDGTIMEKEPITLAKILEFIDNDDICWDLQSIEFTEKLKYLGYYYGSIESNSIEWDHATVYRCSIDNNIYIVGNKVDSEQIEMEQLNWDGTTTLGNDGLPVTLSTQFGNYQRGFSFEPGEFDLNDEIGVISIEPTFNDWLILLYNTDGALIQVQWKD